MANLNCSYTFLHILFILKLVENNYSLIIHEKYAFNVFVTAQSLTLEVVHIMDIKG